MWIIKKLKFESDILKSSNKFIFYKSFYNCFYIFLFIYIKIPKVLSAKYYQENKKSLRKKLVKDTRIFLTTKKNKKWQYGHGPYKNLSENEKQKLFE